jgi:hypothetical protein
MDTYQALSVFEMFIHTICFHRMIYKSVKPKEIAHPIYDTLYYVMIDHPVFHKTVTEKLEYVLSTIKERQTGTVSLIFYHVKPSTGWFSTEEKIEMERWNLPFQWYESYDKSHTHEMKEKRIRSVYLSLLEKLSSVPAPIYQVIQSEIPFEIVDSNKSNSFKDILQFITSGPPKLNLF